MIKIFKNCAQLVTVDSNGKNYKRGNELADLSVLENHSIVVEDGIIKDIVKSVGKKYSTSEIIDLQGKILLPGLIDCHTHTAFAGSRAGEFRARFAGKDYEDIAKEGGGINTTVQAVRNSSFDDMVSIIEPRINYFASQGITTLEIKTGYGLSYYDEIKILQVIKHLNTVSNIDLVSTFLGAHTFPPEYKNERSRYIEIINTEMLPYIAEHNLATFCDAFCESTAFYADEIDKIFAKAESLGIKIKLHSEQFNRIGGIDLALKYNAVSIDHLEVISEEDCRKFSDSETTAVLLPGVSFFLDYGFAPARQLIENDAIVALSTDYNPGSSNIANLNLIMSLASLKMDMTIEETISAVTINAAKALGVSDKVGSIEIGKAADFAIFDTDNYAEIVYQVGKNLNCMTVKNGEVIYKTPHVY